ncbi:MAG: YchJ family metal-binding protein [Ottowia sp.]|uniref:YchJ family protein n=1 Tax=Ottowia sp. TaxID=1898956 RepID=UPI0039E7026E
MKPPRADQACPCGLPARYEACCGRFIDHWPAQPAPDPERLMRSRYTAFARGQADYLRATWHPDHRPAAIDFEPQARWLGLEVRRARLIDATHGEVEFVARYRVAGCAVRLHELSRFVLQDGHWLYTDGDLQN